MPVIYTILLIVGLLIFSVGIVFLFSYISYKKRHLSHDIEFVKKMLPCIDCGMCGEKNCTNFAIKVTEGNREPSACKLISPENTQKIKEHFKAVYKESSKKVAFVRCKGGCKASDKYIYDGAKSCSFQEMLHSGSKECKFACLGCGDCVKACKYRAIKISKRGVAEVIRSKCTGCGACVDACPNKVISMEKIELSVNVVCNNQSPKPTTKTMCEVGCIHCGKCIDICPVNAISVKDNVPVIDPKKCIECYKCVSVCPNHVISRL